MAAESYARGATEPALIEQTIGDCFDAMVAHQPDALALVSRHEGQRFSYRELQAASNRLASALLKTGLVPGDRVGIWSHNNVAWVLMQIFGTWEDGQFRASDLFGREEFITEYERRSGRTVDRTVLHFYDVLSSYKCYVIVGANGLAAARSQHNHQDVLLTFLATTTAMFAGDLVRLLSEGDTP